MNNNSNYPHDPAYMQAEIQRLDRASELQGMKALFAFIFSVGFGVWMVVDDRPISLTISVFGIGVGIWLMRDGARLSLAADELRAQLPNTPPAGGTSPNGHSQGPVAGNPNSGFDELGEKDGF